MTILPWRLTHPDPALAASGHCPRVGYGVSRPRLLRLLSPSKDRSPSGVSCSALCRSVQPATSASADFCRPIPAPCDAGSTWQGDRSPRVRRVTFVPYTCRIYGRTLRVISGFGLLCTLARMRDASYALPVRQAGTLLTASFRSRIAPGTLAVRLAVPITRARGGLPPPSHRSATTPTKRCSRTTRHAWRTKKRALTRAPREGNDRYSRCREESWQLRNQRAVLCSAQVNFHLHDVHC